MPGRGLFASKGGSRGTEQPPSHRTPLAQPERLASRTKPRPPAQQPSKPRDVPPRPSLQRQKNQSSSRASAAFQATPGLASPVPKRGLDLGQIAGAHKPVGLALGSAHVLATACQLSGSSMACGSSNRPCTMTGHTPQGPSCSCVPAPAQSDTHTSWCPLNLRPQPQPHAPLAPALQPAPQNLHLGPRPGLSLDPRAVFGS